MTADPISLTPMITLDDLIGCTSCGAHIALGESKYIDGCGRVCNSCYRPGTADLYGIEPPF
jgi:hypothetical protein